MKNGSYICPCGNHTFTFIARRRRGCLDELLKCSKCGECYNISPCNTNGLTFEPMKKA